LIQEWEKLWPARISSRHAVLYRGADKSLARSGRKHARKHVRDARDFNNIETQAVIKFFFPSQDKAPKEIHAILKETLACFIPCRAKDLSAPCNKVATKHISTLSSCCLDLQLKYSDYIRLQMEASITQHRGPITAVLTFKMKYSFTRYPNKCRLI